VHNSYKAIEAIHGGNLPADNTKIVRNFGALSIAGAAEKRFTAEF